MVSGVIRREYYGDGENEKLLNPKVSPDGKRFSYCKIVKNEQDVFVNEIYTKKFGPSSFPVQVTGINPKDCLYDFSFDGSKIVYVENADNPAFSAFYHCDLDGQNKTRISSRGVEIVSPVVETNESSVDGFVYYYIGHDNLSGYYTLTRHSTTDRNERLYESANKFDFSISKSGSKLVILGKHKPTDSIKIYLNGDFSNSLTYTEENHFIKTATFSSDEDSIYCFICSKTDEKKCKVIEVSCYDGEFPKRTRQLIKTPGNVDVIFLPNE